MATITLKELARVTSVPDESNKDAHSGPAYASFGDEGVTATANAHGNLLQITRYFGNEPSGFYCVDLPETPPPNLIAARMDQLKNFYEDDNVGMRLEFEDCEDRQDWVVDNQNLPITKFIDDRWPIILKETPLFNLSIQYIISKKTIYQEYSFELKNGRSIEIIPNILIDANLFIRNLNFFDPNEENTRGDPESTKPFYETRHNTRVIRKHVSPQTDTRGYHAVGLTIMPFVNGRFHNLEMTDLNHYRLSPGSKALKKLRESRKMVVTIAYTLELMGPDDSSPSSENVSKATQRSSEARDDLWIAKEMIDMRFEILLFTKESHLNFIIRRNLEHILSVCSIPIGDPSETGIVPIALTCGDISNHRIMAGASFYAFELLLLALKHLENLKWACSCDPKGKPCQDYKCRMRYRIRRTCHGHLIWLYENALPNGLDSHRRAKGKGIKNEKTLSAEKSIMDTPFHIIKAADFCRIITDEYILEEITEKYTPIFKRWIQLIHLDNKNNEYAFPRSKDKKIHKFFFSEQAIIWRALQSGKMFGIESSKVFNGKSKTSYSALDIQNSIFEKFSCENPVSNKPMIAVSRSVYGNTFRLNTEDTAIFHAVEHGIFTTSGNSGIGQRKMELWMNTLDHQMESDERIDISWHSPLQAGLAVIMSAKSRRTKSNSMKRRHESAISALLRSSSANGLLTGQLGEDQEPNFLTDYSGYHAYWHAAFEIPYILWMYGANSPHTDRPLSEHAANGEATVYTASMEPILATKSYSSSNQFYHREKPITNYIKKEKVIEYPNEWLYTKPRFLTFAVDLRDEAAKEFYDKNNSEDLGTVIKRAFENMQQLSKPSTNSADSMKGYIVDVPETASLKKLEDFRPNYIQQAINLRLQIDPRVGSNVEEHDSDFAQEDLLPTPAKKRLMHFHEMNFELARACYQASSEAEDLSRFLDRHATYDKYFYEDAQLIFNSWTTELHLSFYQILSGELPVPGDVISKLKTIPFPNFEKSKNSQSINRVSMSFRFDGDIFDSHWVCHFIEFNPQQIQTNKRQQIKAQQIKQQQIKEQQRKAQQTKAQPTTIQPTTVQQTTVQPFTEMKISNATGKNLWQERRILELLIFDKMLDEILRSSRNVLEQIKRSILKNSQRRDNISRVDEQESDIDYDTSMLLAEFEIFDKTPADAFLSIRSAWHQFQRITDFVEEDLKENIDTIGLWMNREEKRHDEPQWPESSEQKYGGTISQLLTKNSRKFDELKRCYDSIKVFNASLTKRMEVASSKWEIQSSDDIRLFTYVTVVFLPISFATGIFSMSDTPSGSTLRHMIIVAVVALGATILALFNAKALDSKMVRPIHHICRDILRGFFVLPCLYFVARYIYYPAFPPKLSKESSAKTYLVSSPTVQNSDETAEKTPVLIDQESKESSGEPSTTKDGSDLFNFKSYIEKAREILHKYDHPTQLARKSFEDAMIRSETEEDQRKSKMKENGSAFNDGGVLEMGSG